MSSEQTKKSPKSSVWLETLKGLPGNMSRSFFRTGYPNTLPRQLSMALNTWALHIHPPQVNRRSISPTHTFGLGVITFALFIILLGTGLFLMLYYVPSPAEAYGRMLDLSYVVTFGQAVRNMHRWAAEGMVVAVVLHMCRVFYTASYKSPREFNWAVGVALLTLTLALSFTGYLLPWDQLSFWAITVGTNIARYIPMLGGQVRFLLLGGDTVGGEALIRFYVLHVAILPVLASVLIGYHFWRIRKDGGLAKPPRKPGPDGKVQSDIAERVPTFPNVVYLETLIFMGTTLVFSLLSVLYNAPLESLADPERPPNPAKAPWYFLGLQEMVSRSAFWGGFILPLVALLGLLLLPYLDRDQRGVGVWFAKERVGMVTLWTLALAGIITVTAVGWWFRGPNWNFYWPWQGWPVPR